MEQKKERIWEIDALRGFFLIFVFASHFTYDLSVFFGTAMPDNPVVNFIFHYGGALFIVISGISATLGSRSFRRGVIVFCCGMGITLATFLLYKLDFLGSGDLIHFGILHLLGVCMMLYPLFKKLPSPVLLILSAVTLAVGIWFESITITAASDGFDIRNYLFVFGLMTPDYAAGDFFPILPNICYFLLGIVLGRTAYKDKKTLFPHFPKDFSLVRAVRFMGRHSLIFYLAHQPVLFGVLWVISEIFG
ncbi:MAG: DUF1624 domain-containing protein [Clostridiales bacterium]|nr:DUF1624 domain-containing protein [Candidatus Equinaster intestinalis]